jgi:hypothetical protein
MDEAIANGLVANKNSDEKITELATECGLPFACVRVS